VHNRASFLCSSNPSPAGLRTTGSAGKSASRGKTGRIVDLAGALHGHPQSHASPNGSFWRNLTAPINVSLVVAPDSISLARVGQVWCRCHSQLPPALVRWTHPSFLRCTRQAGALGRIQTPFQSRSGLVYSRDPYAERERVHAHILEPESRRGANQSDRNWQARLVIRD
jgi:hypothetical protein